MNLKSLEKNENSLIIALDHPLETALLIFWGFFWNHCRTVNLFNRLPTFLRFTYVHVLFHLEFKAAVVSQSALFSGIVLGCHQWWLALLTVILSLNQNWRRSSSHISWVCDWWTCRWLACAVFCEEIVIQGIGCVDSFRWVFF